MTYSPLIFQNALPNFDSGLEKEIYGRIELSMDSDKELNLWNDESALKWNGVLVILTKGGAWHGDKKCEKKINFKNKNVKSESIRPALWLFHLHALNESHQFSLKELIKMFFKINGKIKKRKFEGSLVNGMLKKKKKRRKETRLDGEHSEFPIRLRRKWRN